jgi:hypothetical protein
MKKHVLRIAVLFFFVWTSWACGIADAFVADEIDSIKDSAERARAWQVEGFYQEHGRYPTDEEQAEMFGKNESTETNEAPAKKKNDPPPAEEETAPQPAVPASPPPPTEPAPVPAPADTTI